MTGYARRQLDLPRLTPHAIRAALALAEIHFPRLTDMGNAVDPRDARFFLSGQLGVWSSWREGLSPEQASELDRLLRYRPRRLATEGGFRVSLDAHLRGGASPRYQTGGENLLLIRDGVPAADVLAEALTQLEQAAGTRHWVPAAAQPDGHYSSSVFLASARGSDEFRRSAYWIPPVSVPDQPLLLTDGKSPAQVTVHHDDLLATARRIDEARGNAGFSVHDRLAFFLRGLRAPGGARVSDFALRAGRLNLAVAPTGTGKSVLMRVAATHLAAAGQVIVLVVPDVENTLELVAEIRADLQALDLDLPVAALMSPRRLIEVATRRSDDAAEDSERARWTWQELGYSCMLPVQDGPPWQPGQEPCTDLQEPGQDGRHRCPLISVCEKWQPWRDAADKARVIVTNHAYFQNGSVPIPVVADGRAQGRISTQEFLLRRADVMVIDEVDAFQAHAVAQSGRTLVLARRDGGQLLLEQLNRQRLDQVRAGTVPRDLELDFQRVLSRLGYVPERYLAAVVNGFIDSQDPLGPRQARLHLARRWDNLLACRLFGLDELTERPTDEQLTVFHALFHQGEPRTPLPDGWDALRRQHRLVVSQDPAADRIDQRRQDLVDALTGLRDGGVADPVQTAQLMLRRAFLGEIQRDLADLEQLLPLMRDCGMRLADDVEAALDRGSSWQATPEGPIGRSVFGFAITGDAASPADHKLNAEIISGDPHAYTAELGLTTAAALTGAPRIILGLSATAYLPGAPTFHVHSDVNWYFPDHAATGTGAVTVSNAAVNDHTGRGIVISGIDRRRKPQRMNDIGQMLWEQILEQRLTDLHNHPDQQRRDRARVLLVTNSYQQGIELCKGLIKGGANRSRLCVAVPAPSNDGGDRSGLQIPDDVYALPANRLRTFPTLGRDVLISPFARVARGLNMVVQDQSAIDSIWVCVRPVKLIDDPSALIAHTGAHARLGRQPHEQAAEELAARHQLAADHLEYINRANPAFSRLPKDVRVAIFADVLADLIQLAGRARRGGTNTTLFLVDNAFHPDGAAPGSDFASLFRHLHQSWTDSGTLSVVTEIFGTTLESFARFAGLPTPRSR